MNIVIPVIIVIALIVGVGYVTTQPATSPVPEPATPPVVTNESATNEAAPTDDLVETMTDETPTQLPDAPILDETPTEVAPAASAGTYTTYSNNALAAADDGKRVIFFHASWCPTCRALDADIVANQADIPAGVTIFKADYDAETTLKQQFGVVRQHSVVVLDAAGNQVGDIIHPSELDDILAVL